MNAFVDAVAILSFCPRNVHEAPNVLTYFPITTPRSAHCVSAKVIRLSDQSLTSKPRSAKPKSYLLSCLSRKQLHSDNQKEEIDQWTAARSSRSAKMGNSGFRIRVTVASAPGLGLHSSRSLQEGRRDCRDQKGKTFS